MCTTRQLAIELQWRAACHELTAARSGLGRGCAVAAPSDRPCDCDVSTLCLQLFGWAGVGGSPAPDATASARTGLGASPAQPGSRGVGLLPLGAQMEPQGRVASPQLTPAS